MDKQTKLTEETKICATPMDSKLDALKELLAVDNLEKAVVTLHEMIKLALDVSMPVKDFVEKLLEIGR